MIKKIGIILLAFLCFSFKTGDFDLIKTLPIKGQSIFADHLGNFYFVDGDQLLKYNEDFILQNTYSNKLLGTISSVDVSDPLKILLFYKDFNEVVFVDNTMSAKSDAIKLVNLEIGMPTLACTSYDNGMWVYDQSQFQILRLDKNLQVSSTTGNLNQIPNIEGEIQPNYIVERDGFVYLNSPLQGIFVFDKFGTYYKTISIKNLTKFQVLGENIICPLKGKLIIYNLKDFNISVKVLPEETFDSFQIASKNLYLLKSNELKIYSSKPEIQKQK